MPGKGTELKWMTKKGEIESKSRWIDLAKSMGMCDNEKGIFDSFYESIA